MDINDIDNRIALHEKSYTYHLEQAYHHDEILDFIDEKLIELRKMKSDKIVVELREMKLGE